MDPWAETDWLDRFRSLSAGRTAILITHRLTTAMRADVIHVMADGQIVTRGYETGVIRFDPPGVDLDLAEVWAEI